MEALYRNHDDNWDIQFAFWDSYKWGRNSHVPRSMNLNIEADMYSQTVSEDRKSKLKMGCVVLTLCVFIGKLNAMLMIIDDD